jgi:hypothetical protein
MDTEIDDSMSEATEENENEDSGLEYEMLLLAPSESSIIPELEVSFTTSSESSSSSYYSISYCSKYQGYNHSSYSMLYIPSSH